MTRFVFDFLVARLPDGPTRESIREFADENVLVLDLRYPHRRDVVDLLADDLPGFIDDIPDLKLGADFRPGLSELVRMVVAEQRRSGDLPEKDAQPRDPRREP